MQLRAPGRRAADAVWVSWNRWNALTPAERRVALLIGTGHTNKSASTELGVSVNTVATHLRSVFAKLNIQSRVKLANELHKADLT